MTNIVSGGLSTVTDLGKDDTWMASWLTEQPERMGLGELEVAEGVDALEVAVSLVAAAIEAVEDGRIEFVPPNWSKTYFNWMHGIEDWCISRQLWWGHRIPAWYDDEGRVYVGHDEAEARERAGLGDEVVLRHPDRGGRPAGEARP